MRASAVEAPAIKATQLASGASAVVRVPSASPRLGPTQSPRVGPTQSPRVGPTQSPRLAPGPSPRLGPSASPRVVASAPPLSLAGSSTPPARGRSTPRQSPALSAKRGRAASSVRRAGSPALVQRQKRSSHSSLPPLRPPPPISQDTVSIPMLPASIIPPRPLSVAVSPAHKAVQLGAADGVRPSPQMRHSPQLRPILRGRRGGGELAGRDPPALT